MAPNEATILTNYLLVPANLPAIISLKEFTSFFPKALQPSSQIRILYRNLQTQRNARLDDVISNIEHEIKRGRVVRREILRAKRVADEPLGDDEMDIERSLYGSASGAPALEHNLNTILPDLESSVQDLEAIVKKLEKEETELIQSVKHIVSGLSDLRYGRLSNGQVTEQVLEGLQTVQELCESNR